MGAVFVTPVFAFVWVWVSLIVYPVRRVLCACVCELSCAPHTVYRYVLLICWHCQAITCVESHRHVFQYVCVVVFS